MRKFVRQRTQERLKKLGKRLRALRKRPGDEDALHDLRVANRRLAQCFRTFENSFDKDEAKKLRRKLKRLMARCGDVRDHDIAIKLLAEAGVRDAPLVVSLAAERVKRQKKLSAELERWRGWRGKVKVRRAPGKPEDFAQLELPRMEREWIEAGDKAAKSESYATMHRFRILSKRYRYTLEMFPGTGPRVEKLRELQDHLGGINDCVATRRLIRGHAPAKRALGEFLKVRERAFRAFWKKLGETKRDGTLHIASRRSSAA
jgi:CHAD domain-containing protein